MHWRERRELKAVTAYDAAMQLVVHGDDFGLSESINEGIVDAHTRGILTSTSIVASGSSFEHAIALARTHPTLDLGVHLTLTEERPAAPVASVPSLLRDGATLAPSPGAFMKRFLRGGVALREVALEFEAQVARVREAGVRVTHLDGHQHLHALPGIRREVAALAQRHGIGFIRQPHERLRPFMLVDARRLRRVAALTALNLVCQAPQPWGAGTTDRFVGFYFGGRLNKSNLLTLIADLPQSGSCELMCHPGSAVRERRDPAGVYNRRAECEALCAPDVRLKLNARGIELVSFANLGAFRR